MINAVEWPDVPQDLRPKRLPIEEVIFDGDRAALEAKGWLVFDVRLMANDSDAERAEAVKAWLEGVRLGSIAPDISKLKHVELEATIYGIKNSKGPSNVKQNTDTDLDATQLLSFGSTRAFRGTWNPANNQLKGAVDAAVARVEAPKPVRAAKRKVPALRSGTPADND